MFTSMHRVDKGQCRTCQAIKQYDLNSPSPLSASTLSHSLDLDQEKKVKEERKNFKVDMK
jgi:hypothetical protein